MMTITELQQRYAAHPNVEAMSGLLKNPSVRTLSVVDYVLLLLHCFRPCWCSVENFLLFLFWAIWKRRDISTMTLRRCWGQIKSCFPFFIS